MLRRRRRRRRRRKRPWLHLQCYITEYNHKNVWIAWTICILNPRKFIGRANIIFYHAVCEHMQGISPLKGDPEPQWKSWNVFVCQANTSSF